MRPAVLIDRTRLESGAGVAPITDNDLYQALVPLYRATGQDAKANAMAAKRTFP